MQIRTTLQMILRLLHQKKSFLTLRRKQRNLSRPNRSQTLPVAKKMMTPALVMKVPTILP
jgi:hypothetical protein